MFLSDHYRTTPPAILLRLAEKQEPNCNQEKGNEQKIRLHLFFINIFFFLILVIKFIFEFLVLFLVLFL